MPEIWKQMYNNYVNYEISSYGEVRNMQTNKLLNYRTSKNGNAMVLLRDKNNNKKWVTTLDLMLEYFDDDEVIEQ